MKFLLEDVSKVPVEYEELEYEFTLTIPYGPIDYWSGDQSEKTVTVNHTYYVPVDEVKEFLAAYKLPEDLPENEIDAYFEEHYDSMVEKYIEDIKVYFEDDAEHEAYSEYDGDDDYYDWDDRED